MSRLFSNPGWIDMVAHMRGVARLVIVIGVALHAHAAAQDDPRVAEARTHFDLGERHYTAGDYALSLQEFRTSYEIMHSVGHENAGGILFNIARCYRQLGRDSEAIETYEQFMREAPPDFPARP